MPIDRAGFFGLLLIGILSGVLSTSAQPPSREFKNIPRNICEFSSPGAGALSGGENHLRRNIFMERQTVVEEPYEKSANQRQPPEKVMTLAGIRPGMIIGEIGVGYGRYTVHLAGRVGPTGKIYANDIEPKALAHVAERCRLNRIDNIETVLGQTADPRFPNTGLDMIFMVWTYHMLEEPVEMLRSLAGYLKPGATVVMVEPIPAETEDEIKTETARLGRRPENIRSVSKESLERDAALAGFELVKSDSSLSMDNIFILRVKG
jgi:precorrin-6B methylase 2